MSGTEAPRTDRSPRSARFRGALLLVLVVLLAGSAGAVVWLLAARGDAGEPQEERDAVMSQARQFMLRTSTYGPDGLDGEGRLAENRAQVQEVVSDKFWTAYEQSLEPVEQLVATQSVGQSAEVLGVGVQYLDDDSARALVAGESTFTRETEDGTAETVRTQTFRVVVDLVKQGGTWLVDQSELAGDRPAAPSGAPSGAPQPSEGATP